MINIARILFLLFVPAFCSIEDTLPARDTRSFKFQLFNPFRDWDLFSGNSKFNIHKFPFPFHHNYAVGTKPITFYNPPYFTVPNIIKKIFGWKKNKLWNFFHKPYIVKNERPTTTTTTVAPDVLQCVCGLRNPARKIVGGTETDVNEYPWMAALCMTDSCSTASQFCGGSLINNMYILTAAHCFDTFTGNPEEITISLGDHNINSDSEAFPVVLQAEEIIIHPEYVVGGFLNDIALIKLDSKPPLSSRIRPICLPENDADSNAGDDAIVTGWGATVFDGGPVEALMEVGLPVLSNADCAALLSITLDPSFICAGEVGVDSCQGDSGGPLSTEFEDNKYVQIGVVSFGQNCGTQPGIYTRVNQFIDWIQQNTEDALYCAN